MLAPAPLRTFLFAAFAAASLAVGAPAAAQPAAAAQASAPASRPAVAGSLSASAPDADCPSLRKQYMDSQACFQRYRDANGSVRPEAFQRCREVVDPSPRCGPNLPTR